MTPTPVTPGLVTRNARLQTLNARTTMIQSKLGLRNQLEDDGVFRDPKKGILTY